MCLPGGKLAGIEKKISELSSSYDTIMVVAGGNDCDTSPSTPALTVIDAFASVIDAAKAKVSSVCPRLKTADTTNTIDAVNAGLVTLCADKDVIFADSTPSFTLGDGSVNDGYLHRDGVHLTHAAVNRLAKNLRVKNETMHPVSARGNGGPNTSIPIRQQLRAMASMLSGLRCDIEDDRRACHRPGHKSKFCPQ